ncbi:MAG: adenine/guanine/hypoxanthine permease, partial [Miltoncostaeaceae bacterium]|nr:adenine/guanine/hypoxanthine permease [Miltoncostaeaceae bacterium]
VLAVIIIGFIAGVRLPGNFPVGLAALLLGSAIAWAGGLMSAPAVGDAAEQIAVGIPTLNLSLLFDGLEGISPLLATAIPLGIYNFTEAMSNVESAAAAGDRYNLRSVLLADGTGAVIGSCLGSPFPPAVYIGHPGWKDAGGRTGYSMATGAVIALMCFLGLFGLLSALLPIPAIVPILLFIGLVIGAQAFRATPKAYYPAVVLAMVPNIAQWATGQVDNALAAAGTTASQVGYDALAGAGTIYGGLSKLGEGAVLAGMVLGAIAVFMIDRRFLWAAGYSIFGAGLAAVGLIHGARVHLFESPGIALGYVLMGAVCLGFHFLGVPVRETDEADPMDVEVRAERARAPAPATEGPGPLIDGAAPAPAGGG